MYAHESKKEGRDYYKWKRFYRKGQEKREESIGGTPPFLLVEFPLKWEKRTGTKPPVFTAPNQLVLRLSFLTKSGTPSTKPVFPFPFTPANSCFLQLELPKTHQKHDLITSQKKKKKRRSVNMTPFYLLIHLDK